MIEITGDSAEYEYITEAIELSKDVDGMCLEIGLRRGMGTKTIIDAVAELGINKVVISVDPYGSIEYEHRESQFCRLDYTEEMMVDCLTAMCPYALSKGVKWRFFPLEDTEFFSSFKSGIPLYDLYKKKVNKYSFAHLDGPHGGAALSLEIKWFYERMDKGATIVVDDVTPDFIDFEPIHDLFEQLGWKQIKIGNKKAIYQKI